MRIGIYLLAIVVLGFTSCMKEEQPYTLPEHGDATHQTMRMGSDYGTQFFYDLKNAKIIHSSKVESWNLAFESAFAGEGIFLNGGSGMALVRTEKTDFAKITHADCDGETWLQDNPNGDQSESGFGLWNKDLNSRNKIYIVRLDPMGEELRTIKLKNVTTASYEIEVGKIGTEVTSSHLIQKDPTRVYTYFDLRTLEACGDVEPVKESWDFVMTRYGFTFYDQTPALPYIVTGVLTNPTSAVYKDSLNNFYDIDADFLDQCTMSKQRDAVGYDWKYYNFDLGIYHLRQDFNFIIKTQHDDYFKLRFVDFYDDNGLKGTPSFEFKQIQ